MFHVLDNFAENTCVILKEISIIFVIFLKKPFTVKTHRRKLYTSIRTEQILYNLIKWPRKIRGRLWGQCLMQTYVVRNIHYRIRRKIRITIFYRENISKVFKWYFSNCFYSFIFSLTVKIAQNDAINWKMRLTMSWIKNDVQKDSVVYWPSTRPNMPFQSDAPEGSDIFRWQLWEEIA